MGSTFSCVPGIDFDSQWPPKVTWKTPQFRSARKVRQDTRSRGSLREPASLEDLSDTSIGWLGQSAAMPQLSEWKNPLPALRGRPLPEGEVILLSATRLRED